MLAKIGLIAIPITLLILLFVFGSVVAALVPLLLSLTAVFATMGLVAIPSQFFPVDEQIAEVILLIGLAVGIDYSLFYLRREREERRAGRSERAALEAAAATSGRAVLISGITVMIAMAGMFLSGDKTFMSFSVGTMMVVLVAMIGSLTVLPALLARLGDNVEKGRIPYLHRLASKDGRGRVWGPVLDAVMRRPVGAAVASTAVLVTLALPAVAIKTANPGIDDIKIAEVEPLKKLIDAFPGGNAPAQVAIRADDVRAEPVRAAIAQLERQALATGKMRQPIEIEASRDSTVAVVRHPAGRRRHRRSLQGRPRDAPRRRAAGDARSRRRDRVRGHGRDGGRPGLGRRHEEVDPARVRLRPPVRVPDPVDLVPLDRRRAEGDPPQPALGRGGVRRSSSRSSSGAGASRSSASTRTAGLRPGCRCSCS